MLILREQKQQFDAYFGRGELNCGDISMCLPYVKTTNNLTNDNFAIQEMDFLENTIN